MRFTELALHGGDCSFRDDHIILRQRKIILYRMECADAKQPKHWRVFVLETLRAVTSPDFCDVSDDGLILEALARVTRRFAVSSYTE